jgi:hypothetical protein
MQLAAFILVDLVIEKTEAIAVGLILLLVVGCAEFVKVDVL